MERHVLSRLALHCLMWFFYVVLKTDPRQDRVEAGFEFADEEYLPEYNDLVDPASKMFSEKVQKAVSVNFCLPIAVNGFQEF